MTGRWRTGAPALAGLASLALLLVWSLRHDGGDHPWRRGVERLKSLPYLSWTAVEAGQAGGPAAGGVSRYEPDLAAPGLNLYASEAAPGARLVDMAGRVVLELHDRRPEPTPWKLVKPLGAGRFGVLAAGGTLLELDLRSRLGSVVSGGFHHDFERTAAGWWAPAFDTRRLPAVSRWLPLRDDVLTFVDDDGRAVIRLSMGELIAAEPALRAAARARPRRLLDWRIDALHTNTVTILPRQVEYSNGLVFPAGSVLVCWRNLDTVAVIDPDPPRIVWHWGLGELDQPHQPTLLDDGNLLVFDNGTRRRYSRVVELDPASGQIVWQYRDESPEGFFSSSRGGAQRLANGNTLIVESQRGRAFEVTRAGRVVWEFHEPRTRGGGLLRRRERATIYRLERLPPAAVQRLHELAGPGAG